PRAVGPRLRRAVDADHGDHAAAGRDGARGVALQAGRTGRGGHRDGGVHRVRQRDRPAGDLAAGPLDRRRRAGRGAARRGAVGGGDDPAAGRCPRAGHPLGGSRARARPGLTPLQSSQEQKAEAFRALHDGEPFVIPNPWDAGSAKAFAGLGFRALASTSSGFAFTLGRPDGAVTLDEVAGHLQALDRATSLPVSADLENGYGPRPEDAALAIARAAEAGAVGGSIEDYDPDGEVYPVDHAAERVAAAVEAARGLGFPFTLTARAENHIRGNPDL